MFHQVMNRLDISFHGYSSMPLNQDHILLFVGFLHLQGYAPTSILSYLSALGYAHKLMGFVDPTSNFAVQKALKGAMKVHPTVDVRLPITINILQQMSLALDHTISNPYLRLLFRSMYTIAFFGLMRVGEITKSLDGEQAVNFDQFRMYENHLIITISKFKHNMKRQPFDLVMVKQQLKEICPLTNLIEYIRVRGTNPGPLFCLPDGSPVPRELFIRHLKNTISFCGLSTKLFKSHSFRIGGASFYAELGLSDEQIRLIGRWKSDAFKKYIRCQRILLAISR